VTHQILPVGGYNLGNVTTAQAVTSLRTLLEEFGIKVVGTCESGDQAAAMSKVDALPDTEVLRKAKGAPNRLALALSDLDLPEPLEWGYFPLNPGHEEIERTVAGNGRVEDGHKLAEPKFIIWVVINGVMVGMTHYIPSTAVRTRITRRYKHPDARGVYRVQVDRTVEWFESGGDVLLGDFNGTPTYDLLRPLRQVAHCHAPASRKKPRRIDHLYIRIGSGIEVVEGTLQAIDNLSSDHPAVIAQLKIPEWGTFPPAHERAAEILEKRALSVPRKDVKGLILEKSAELRTGV
jgi:hypothetical protein